VKRLVFLLVFLIAAVSHAQTHQIRILHFNDFHGFAEPHQSLGAQEPLGGVAWLAAKVKELGKGKPTLFLAAGDMIQGDNWANLFKGESVIRVLNYMGLDAMVLGNHEFDFGQEVLLERMGEARFPVLGANVSGLKGVVPYMVKEVGGLKVGVIGVVGADTPLTTHPRNVVGLGFLDPAETLKKNVQKLSAQVDLLVALTHCGFKEDRELASRVPEVQVIVGGHSHTKLDRPAVVGDTIIVQAWEHGKTLGILDLWLQGKKVVRWEGRLEEIRPDLGEPDQGAKELVEHYSRKLRELLGQVIGHTLVDLDGEGVRNKETNLGNLVADVLREVTGAQAAIINGGSIRKSIPKGPITLEQVYGSLPFDNYAVAIPLKGSQLWEALEHGVNGRGSGRFPQVSGLKISYWASAPQGSRLKEVLVGDRPLDLEATYVVAMNDFLAAGGDGYRSFTEAIREHFSPYSVGGTLVAEGLLFSEPGRWIRDLVAEYIRQKSPLETKTEGRMEEKRGQ